MIHDDEYTTKFWQVPPPNRFVLGGLLVISLFAGIGVYGVLNRFF